MRIGLLGFGKMGRAVALAAPALGHTIGCTIAPSLGNVPFDEALIKNIDLFIEFTCGEAVLNNVSRLAYFEKSVVVGTTGWESDLNALKSVVIETGIGVLYAPNFSLGAYLFSSIISAAAKQLIPMFEPALYEEHHKEKRDALSGTAKELLSHLPPGTPTSSLRLGTIIGHHEVVFDAPFDQIRLSHTAKSKKAFAHGALKAAEWLQGKKGFFTLEDLFKDV